MEKAVAPHSSTLAWKIPWTEEPGGLRSMGSLRVGHDWATSLSLFTFMHWRRKWQPTPVFLPGESHGQGAWWAAVYGVTQSRTRLKWLSSSLFHVWRLSFFLPSPWGMQDLSSLTWHWTSVPCIASNHWTIREVQQLSFNWRTEHSHYFSCRLNAPLKTKPLNSAS